MSNFKVTVFKPLSNEVSAELSEEVSKIFSKPEIVSAGQLADYVRFMITHFGFEYCIVRYE